MPDVQAAVQAAIDEMVATGTETGLQVSVLSHGRVAASTAKGVAASLAHVLAERGDLSYDMRLSEVWPEFGSRGKDRITLRQVLMHTAGLPGLPPDTGDRPDRVRALARDAHRPAGRRG